MSKTQILEYVKTFADRAHGEQVRKYTGERYIGHPVRVMELVREFNDEVSILSAALLHDVLEDTRVTPQEMEEALLQVMDSKQAEKTIQLVVELTDIFVKNNYPRLNRRTRKEKEAQRLSAVGPDAQSIKYADIIDNVTDIVKQDSDFAKVFVRETKKMLQVMEAGYPPLRAKAVALVDQCLQNLKKPAELY
ncbi:MAG: HD domain-containing protein [Cyclobacteriaceae bacterium]